MIRRYLFCFLLAAACTAAPGLALAQSSETDLLSAAQQAFNDGFSDMAVKYLEDFLDKYPDSPHLPVAKLLLGQCDFLRGQYDKALSLFEDLSHQPQKKDEIFFWRGETYLKQNRLPEAQADYQTVIKYFPQSIYLAQAYYSLGWSYFAQKRFHEAKIVFSVLTSRYPNNQLSEDAALKIAECDYNSMRLKDAIRDFEHLLRKYPKSSHLCEAYFNTAESYYYLNRFDSSVEYYQKVLDSSCDDNLRMAAYTSQGWSYIKLGRFPEAQNELKKAENFCKSKNLSAQDIILAQANLAYEQGSYDQALALFTKFIDDYPRDPHWTQGYLGRANVYYLMGRYDQARYDYQRLYDQTDPDIFVKSRFGLGWCEFKLGSPAKAIERFQDVFNQAHDDATRANALIQMGDVYQESNQTANAVGMYERVKKLYPATEMMDYILYRQSIGFLKLGKIDSAHEGFSDLQSNYPKSKYLEDIDYYMGVISFKKGVWSKSARIMERYLKGLSRPSDFTPEANYILALSLLNLKEPEEALNVFQKILRLYPNDTGIAQNADIGIAKCLFELGQNREAVKRFKMIVFKYPKTNTEYEALLWLAQYYLKSSDTDAAVGFYKSIIDEFPNSPQIDQMHYELGQAYEIQGQSDAALEQYRAISADDKPLMSKTRFAIAGIMSKDLNPQRAIAAYKNIIASSPQFAGEAYLKLGQLYRNTQDYENEIGIYQEALAARQGTIDRAHIQFNLADTMELMSRTDEAIAQYLKIPDLYPGQQSWVVKALLRVAKIYEEGGDWDAARVTYQKINQLKTPEAAYAQERLEWIKNNAGKKGSSRLWK